MDEQEKPDQPPPASTVPPAPAERELPLDARLLSDAVIELNISRKNVGIYPPGHIQITKSIDRAFDSLQKMFEVRAEMTLGVAKDTLLVGQDYLDRRNPVYRDFALSMNQQGIAAVTFIQGLVKDELVKFHRLLTTKPEDIRSEGGILNVTAGADIPHIRIQAIDYGRFHVTEEKEILKPAQRSAEKPSVGVWQDFVSHLVTGSLAGAGEGVSIADAEQFDPAELARLLNERKLDPNTAMESYDEIITTHVRASTEKKRRTTAQSESLANLNRLVKELHPELRKQFLSVAFRHAASQPSQDGTEDLLGGMPDDMIIEMIRNASAAGKEISPTLAGMMQKLSQVRSTELPGRQSRQAPEQPVGAAQVISPEQMQTLFDRESYEDYVTPDYDATLKRLTEHSGQSSAGPVEGISPDEFSPSLEDDHLDFQIGRALLAFMEEELDDEDYLEFSRKLIAVVPDLLGSGNFTLLLDVLESLRRHVREKKSPVVRAQAEESLAIFHDPAFIAQAVKSFDAWARTKGKEAAGFLLSLGPEAVPGLLDIYSEDQTPGGRRILFDLLCNFGKPAVQEAQRRLHDPRAYYVRNLLMLIRWAGNATVVASVKPLLRHADEKVRLETLAVLLRFRDAEAIELLRQALRSKDPDVSSQAVFLAGQYRVAAVIDDLLALIKKVILFEADYRVNEEIIKALGEIGDRRAVPELEKLARASWSLHRESLQRMKVVLYDSLGRYPKDVLAGLISIGEQSGDDRIIRACRKLAEKR
ncbi:MAG: hypothetical protein A2X56_15230 [Nitrospirae bacterium GWC2_57_13]|nr:MAG: hypothetical protein A2X56_15230 [Nitrospirae bacterium GWC2_57_13]